MTKTRTISSFEALRRQNDGSLIKYAQAAKKVMHEGLTSAFASQMVECKIRIHAIENGTLKIEIYENSTKAQKECRNFSLHFSLHGKAMRNLVYHGPVLKQERILSYIAANRDVNLNVTAFTKKMNMRKEKIRTYAETLKEAAIKIGQHDKNVASALEIVHRDTIKSLFQKAVF